MGIWYTPLYCPINHFVNWINFLHSNVLGSDQAIAIVFLLLDLGNWYYVRCAENGNIDLLTHESENYYKATFTKIPYINYEK